VSLVPAKAGKTFDYGTVVPGRRQRHPPTRSAEEDDMTLTPSEHNALMRRGIRLEWATTAWNAMEVFVTVSLGVASGSLALVAFGLDSMIEVFASMVVIWHLQHGANPAAHRTRLALRLIAGAFLVLAAYLLVASVRSLIVGSTPENSPVGIAYLAVTAVVMFTLAAAKRRTARPLGSEPLEAEASMTFLDGCLCLCILTALAVNMAFGWWWADGAAALAIAGFAAREAVASLREAAET
jgi:divalent metal cation (Fe/Co/Zn/Cd) transporter